MLKKFSGYENLQLLSDNDRSVVYRGQSESDHSSVVLKIVKSEFPSPDDVATFQRESEILTSAAAEGIPRLKHFENSGRNLFLVFDSREGTSLDKIIGQNPLELNLFLGMTEKILVVLGNIHRCQIIHRDIKPHNMIYDAASGEIEIIDFGLAVRFDSHMGQVQSLCGTLEYLSPEQTGRLNRHVDHRTDIYSLGITFYQMLTGRRPFEGKDALELVHAHIALTPPPLRLARPDIPPLLAQIVEKMMKKAPADRYQTAGGVARDLQKFVSAWKKGATDIDFPLGVDDISENFFISAKVYGREAQLAELSAAFLEVKNGARKFFLIDGPPGIGKSALVKELTPLVVENGGWMVSGKYDQHHRDIPFSAFVQALGSLVRHILTLPIGTLKPLTQKLKENLNDEGGVLTLLMPQLELLLGPQKAVPVLTHTENKLRLIRVLRAFLQTAVSLGNTLVLFLDDLQWADGGSRELLYSILSDQPISNILIVAAVRGNEITPHHPLQTWFKDLEGAEVVVSKITMAPLRAVDIQHMVVETLHCSAEAAVPLVRLLIEKTAGNPFFIHQFLKRLYEKGHLRFHQGWHWDQDAVAKMDATNNVLDLLVEKINSLPTSARRLLCTAAGLSGNIFSIADIAALGEMSELEILRAAEDCLCAGLMARLDEHIFRFVHDRIQEAAYGLLTEASRTEIHYKFGHQLLNQSQGSALDENIFRIVQHLNRGKALITTDEERLRLAQLNQIAMSKGRQSTSNESVIMYARAGLAALETENWLRDEELLNDFFSNVAESQALLLQLEDATKTILYVIEKTSDLKLKTRAYTRYLRILQSRMDYTKMEEVVLEVLKVNHIRVFPRSPLALLWNIVNLLIIFGFRGTGTLTQLPKKTPEDIDEIYSHGVVASANREPKVLMYYVTILIRRFLKTGHLESTAPMLTAFSMLLYTSLRMPKMAMALVKSAFEFDAMYEPTFLRGWTDSCYGSYISPWRDDAPTTLKHLVKGYQSGSEIRYRHIFTQVGLIYQIYIWLTSGKDLPSVLKEIDALEQPFKAIDSESYWNRWLDAREFVNLMTDEPVTFPPPSDEEFAKITHNKMHNSGWRASLRLWQHTLLENYPAALSDLEMIKDFVRLVPSFGYGFSLFHLCRPLVYASLYPTANFRTRRIYARAMARDLKVLRRWARNSAIFSPYYQLVLGKILGLRGDFAGAEKALSLAFDQAAKQGLSFIEAQAHEFLADMMLKTHRPSQFRMHAQESLKTFAFWGARAKVRQLEEKWPNLEKGHGGGISDRSRTLSSASISANSTQSMSDLGLDVASIMKSSAALSQEIEMVHLISKLNWILTESAGAERCVLLTGTGPTDLKVVAETLTARGPQALLEVRDLAQFPELPHSLILFAARSHEMVAVADAHADPLHAHDPYLREQKVRSVLCLPMLNKGEFKGLVYLEHRSSADVFNLKRIKVLQILISQATISLENARLYGQAVQKARMETELKTAKAVQDTLFPPESADYGPVQIAGAYLAATECGGDLWFHNHLDNQTYIWVGDATGHGAPAALITSAARATIATMKHLPTLDPAGALRILGQSIHECSKGRLNMTFFAGAVDARGRMRYGNAAQPEPFLIHAETLRELRQDLNPSLPRYRKAMVSVPSDASELLGQSEFQNYTLHELQLTAGDTMILFSDGIIELENEKHEQWGSRNFQNAILDGLRTYESLEGARDSVLGKIHAFRGERELQDDITLVFMKYKGE